MNLGITALTVLLLAAPAAQPAPVPVEQEPFHKTAFKNDYVQAFRVNLDPGQSTLMHIHAHDDAAVRLSVATYTQEKPGSPVGPKEEMVPGLVTARTNEPTALIHRVNNVGKTPFDVIDVQVLKRPDGPETALLSMPAAENPKLRAYRYEIAPGASTAQHTHKRPYLLVAATDMNLRMTSPDGRSMEHPIKAGDMHWVDTEVTHSFTNLGKEKGILVEFELK